MSHRPSHSPKPRTTPAAMKTVHSSSSTTTTTTSSSVKSSTTGTMEDDRSENRDSCYYPGCRKDANCNCDMCLASINATLDLMPFSIQKSSLTKFSVSSRPKTNRSVEHTPISFDASILSTPTSGSPPPIPVSPGLKSSARLKLKEKMKKRERKWGFGCGFWRLVLGLSLIYLAVCGFSKMVSGVLKPVLSPEMVRNVGEKSWVLDDLDGKLRFLQKEVEGLLRGSVSNCSYPNSIWEISQDGLLLSSQCTLYKSAIEEVSIWGWPLQTAGLLTSGFSSRSFTILSGRVTEWSDGKFGYVIRKANTSWVQRNWGASAVQLDPNTWTLEYRWSSTYDNQRLVSALLAFSKNRMSRMLGKMQQKFWLSSTFGNNQYLETTARNNIKVPT